MNVEVFDTERLRLRTTDYRGDRPMLLELDKAPGVEDNIGRVSKPPKYDYHAFTIFLERVPIGVAVLSRRTADSPHLELVCASLSEYRQKRLAVEASVELILWAHRRGLTPIEGRFNAANENGSSLAGAVKAELAAKGHSGLFIVSCAG